MRVLRSSRWILLALLLSLVPASSYAGVLISVGFAPPVLPVYEQPPCPEPGWMWTPGYWAYGDDGYYWVPGTWVPAPYEGALWTPPYWGWSGGLYVFHMGYWGPHVGYYGGVNYGFGYLGIGFIGGRWHGHDFEYNRAYMHVDDRFHHVYEDRHDEGRYIVARDSHIAYSGGPGGIRHDPGPEERMAEHDRHTGRTSYQTEHVSAAMGDRNSYFNNNHGRPANVAVARPLQGTRNMHVAPTNNIRQGQQGSFNNRGDANSMRQNRNQPESRPAPQYQNRQQPQQYHPQPQQQYHPQPQPQYQPRNESRPAPQSRPEAQPQYRPQPQNRPQPAYRPAPERSQPQSRPEPQHESRPAPRQQEKERPEHK